MENKKDKNLEYTQTMEDSRRSERKILRSLLGMGILLVGIIIISFAIGRYPLHPLTVLEFWTGKLLRLPQEMPQEVETILFQVRLPRIVAALLIGAGLAIAGSVYQGMFNNPMVSPDILGSTAGAGFGAALGILIGLNAVHISMLAFVMGLTAVLLTVVIASRYEVNPIMGLVLAGIMISSLGRAMISFVKLVADTQEQLPEITFWLMGSLASIRNKDLVLLVPIFVIGIIPLFLLRWRLNLMTLEEREATSLGVNIKQLRILVIVFVTLLTSISVALSGMIGWIGLVVPHIARKLVGSDYRYQLAASGLLGGGFLLVVDNFARTLTSFEIPLGILTAFIGAPFFLYLISKGGKQ